MARLNPLLSRDDISDIMVNGAERYSSKSPAAFSAPESVSATISNC